MRDLTMKNLSGLVKVFRFVTPDALSVLEAAGWKPLEA